MACQNSISSSFSILIIRIKFDNVRLCYYTIKCLWLNVWWMVILFFKVHFGVTNNENVQKISIEHNGNHYIVRMQVALKPKCVIKNPFILYIIRVLPFLYIVHYTYKHNGMKCIAWHNWSGQKELGFRHFSRIGLSGRNQWQRWMAFNNDKVVSVALSRLQSSIYLLATARLNAWQCRLGLGAVLARFLCVGRGAGGEWRRRRPVCVLW